MHFNPIAFTAAPWLRRRCATALAALWLGAVPLAHGMTHEVRDNIVFGIGTIDADLNAFEAAIQNPAVDTLVLINSWGGDTKTGMRLGRLVASRKITTVVAGNCDASCSIVFMGGAQRRFTDAFGPAQTYVGVRGPFDKITKRVIPESSGQIYAFFKAQIGDKFNADVINKGLYEMDDEGALLKIYDPQRTPIRPPLHCRAAQIALKDCSLLREHTAFTLGIVTQPDLLQLELPTSMAPNLQLFGHVLSQPFPDLNDFLADTAKKRCVSPACTKGISEFSVAKPFSAMAFPFAGPSISYVSGMSTANQAAARALSICNFSSSSGARLCEMRMVNGKDPRALYANEKALQEKALATLTPPEKRFYGEEEFGGTFTQAQGLRTAKWRDITPSSIPGITTIATQALAVAIKGVTPPVVIDVGGLSGQTVPTARMLVNGGLANDVPDQERQYEEQFERLMPVLAPNLDAPVVFYCYGRDSWLSVNAAMRAKKMGYKNVFWYRGGISAWQAAGLTTVPQLPRAALYPR